MRDQRAITFNLLTDVLPRESKEINPDFVVNNAFIDMLRIIIMYSHLCDDITQCEIRLTNF